MAATQTERIWTTTFDGKKVVLVNVQNPVFLSGASDIAVNSVSEVLEVLGPMFGVSPAVTTSGGTALQSGQVFEYASFKSPTIVKNGLRVTAATQGPGVSGAQTWTFASPTQMSGTNMNFLVTGI